LAVFAIGATIGYGHPPSDAVNLLDTALYLVAGALCILRAVLVRQERAAWAAFGFGMVCWGAAEVSMTTDWTASGVIPVPSASLTIRSPAAPSPARRASPKRRARATARASAARRRSGSGSRPGDFMTCSN
jgi:hypothetical protein